MSERDTYYTAARTWADDRVAAAAKQMRLAWIVAGIAGGIAAMPVTGGGSLGGNMLSKMI